MSASCSGCHGHPPHDGVRCQVEVKVVDFWVPCPCVASGALPQNGERLVFGEHRLPREQRYGTAAWPSPSQMDAQRDAALRRALKNLDRRSPEPVDSERLPG